MVPAIRTFSAGSCFRETTSTRRRASSRARQRRRLAVARVLLRPSKRCCRRADESLDSNEGRAARRVEDYGGTLVIVSHVATSWRSWRRRSSRSGTTPRLVYPARTRSFSGAKSRRRIRNPRAESQAQPSNPSAHSQAQGRNPAGVRSASPKTDSEPRAQDPRAPGPQPESPARFPSPAPIPEERNGSCGTKKQQRALDRCQRIADRGTYRRREARVKELETPWQHRLIRRPRC